MAERVNGILLNTSVVVAHLRGSIDLQALECDMPLATRDDHFRQVERLEILWW